MRDNDEVFMSSLGLDPMWAIETDGDVEWGYFFSLLDLSTDTIRDYMLANAREELPAMGDGEITLGLGWYVVWEDSRGFVGWRRYDTEGEARADFEGMQADYTEWLDD